ncbi:MAG: Ig-like domain-containing protein, partial [Bacillota bacterium]
MNGGVVIVPPGQTLTVISAPVLTSSVTSVSYNAYALEKARFRLIDAWRYSDLLKNYLRVNATEPANGQYINYLGLYTITMTFDNNIKKGPSFTGITITSSDESKFTMESLSGNTLTLVSTTPFGAKLGGTLWTVRIPKDAILSLNGKPLETDYIFSFTVTGVN